MCWVELINFFDFFFLKSHGWKTPQRYLMGEEKGPAESKSPGIQDSEACPRCQPPPRVQATVSSVLTFVFLSGCKM